MGKRRRQKRCTWWSFYCVSRVFVEVCWLILWEFKLKIHKISFEIIKSFHSSTQAWKFQTREFYEFLMKVVKNVWTSFSAICQTWTSNKKIPFKLDLKLFDNSHRLSYLALETQNGLRKTEEENFWPLSQTRNIF